MKHLIIDVENCQDCPMWKYMTRPNMHKDGGFNCVHPKASLKKDMGGNHVSDHKIETFKIMKEQFDSSQHGMFPLQDEPKNPLMDFFKTHCPLDDA